MADGVPTWEEVARDYGRFLYSVAYRLAGNDDDAQDLVQESLIRIRKGLERYEPGSLEGWLARIVTNVFLDEVRRRKRRPTDALPDDPERVLPTTPAADEVPTGLSDEVQRALGSLPDDFRVPVVLCDVSDLSYEQIAAATGVPIGTVRSRIHRGRRLLRAALVADGVTGP
jgi:RNA polymerase sigma-70 factor (ECF subfamily)